MERSQRAKERAVKTLTSILAAGAVLAFAAQAGSAAGVKHVKKSELAKHSAIRGYGPYAYLGNTAAVSPDGAGYGPYAYLRDLRLGP
jgi:hypothetical protein